MLSHHIVLRLHWHNQHRYTHLLNLWITQINKVSLKWVKHHDTKSLQPTKSKRASIYVLMITNPLRWCYLVSLTFVLSTMALITNGRKWQHPLTWTFPVEYLGCYTNRVWRSVQKNCQITQSRTNNSLLWKLNIDYNKILRVVHLLGSSLKTSLSRQSRWGCLVDSFHISPNKPTRHHNLLEPLV